MNKRTLNGATPIMAALCHGHLKSAKILVENGADMHIKDKNDQSIIHLAASINMHKVIEKILKGKEIENDPNKKPKLDDNDQFENTPLHLACSKGNQESVKVLIALGAAIENKNEDEMTPFLLAAENGHADVVEWLLDKFETNKHLLNDTDEGENSALHLAASRNLSKTVEVLLNHKADFRKRNMKGQTPLDCAAANGSYKCALKILDAGAEIDSIEQKRNGHLTPLQLTAKEGHANVTKLLLERGAKVTSRTWDEKSALELAIEHNHLSVIKVILESDCWKTALSEYSIRKRKMQTPMRMLISEF